MSSADCLGCCFSKPTIHSAGRQWPVWVVTLLGDCCFFCLESAAGVKRPARMWYLLPRGVLFCRGNVVRCTGLARAGTGAGLNRQEKEMQAEVVLCVSLLLTMPRANSFPAGKAP